MSIIMVDGIKDIVLHNGVVRVDCVSAGPNGETRPSGTLLIPGVITATVLQTLANALQELDKKLREHNEAQAAATQPKN
jgi:hypothetical protein